MSWPCWLTCLPLSGMPGRLFGDGILQFHLMVTAPSNTRSFCPASVLIMKAASQEPLYKLCLPESLPPDLCHFNLALHSAKATLPAVPSCPLPFFGLPASEMQAQLLPSLTPTPWLGPGNPCPPTTSSFSCPCDRL